MNPISHTALLFVSTCRWYRGQNEHIPVVSVVDDDEQVRESLAALVQSMNLDVECYASGREFLDRTSSPPQPGCVVLDLRMPQLSGLEVIEELTARRIRRAGDHDQRARRHSRGRGGHQGRRRRLSGKALSRRRADGKHSPGDRAGRARIARRKAIATNLLDRYETLTADEKEVLELTVAGKPDKAIAQKLDLSLRTIQLRRASVMRKMHAHSRAELIGLAHRIDGPGGNLRDVHVRE